MDISLIGALAARDGFIAAGQPDKFTMEPKATQTALPISEDEYRALCDHVQEVTRQQMQSEEVVHRSRDDVVRGRFRSIALHCFRELDLRVPEPDVPVLIQKLFDDILGYGPLERYFWDPDVTEIIIIGTRILVEKQSGGYEAEEGFDSIEHARNIVERMLAPTGRRLDMAQPRVNARLFDGSRLMAHAESVTPDGLTVTIRRFRHDLTIAGLIKGGALSARVADFIQAAVLAKQNIAVSGSTGSGKTTLLNAIGSFIPRKNERLITIEDPTELQLQHPHVRRLEARPPNLEGKGEVSQSELVADALRMFPTRIIVGEVRKDEALEMLRAMGSGHPGSLTTGHADTTELFLNQALVGMVQEANKGLPHGAILSRIASAIDIVVQIVRERNGLRRLDHISEVDGVERSSDGQVEGIRLNHLWQYDSDADDWLWVAKQFNRAEALLHGGGWQCPN